GHRVSSTRVPLVAQPPHRTDRGLPESRSSHRVHARGPSRQTAAAEKKSESRRGETRESPETYDSRRANRLVGRDATRIQTMVSSPRRSGYRNLREGAVYRLPAPHPQERRGC